MIKPISSVQSAENFEWVVENMFALKFISILFGEPGGGKTWILMDTGIKISQGLPVFNGIETDSQTVLLLEGDVPDTLIKERLNKFVIQPDDKKFKYVNRYKAERDGVNLNLSTELGRNNFEEIIKASGAVFVVIDTLISFIDDEKDAEIVKKAVDHLRTIADKYNCHILICHHTRKRESKQKRKKLDQSDLIGTSIIARLSSIILGIDIGDNFKLLATKKTWFSQIPSMELNITDTEDGKVEIKYETTTISQTKVENAYKIIWQYISNGNIFEFTRKDLEIKYKGILSESAIRGAINKLLEEQKIKAEGNTKVRKFIVQNILPF